MNLIKGWNSDYDNLNGADPFEDWLPELQKEHGEESYWRDCEFYINCFREISSNLLEQGTKIIKEKFPNVKPDFFWEPRDNRDDNECVEISWVFQLPNESNITYWCNYDKECHDGFTRESIAWSISFYIEGENGWDEYIPVNCFYRSY